MGFIAKCYFASNLNCGYIRMIFAAAESEITLRAPRVDFFSGRSGDKSRRSSL